MRSESQPELKRSSEAVLSALPSIRPRLATEALRVPVMNSGSTGMIISVETSVSSDVRPRATMLRLMPGRPRAGAGAWGAAEVAGGGAVTAAEPSTWADRLAAPRGGYSIWDPFELSTALVHSASERRTAAT